MVLIFLGLVSAPRSGSAQPIEVAVDLAPGLPSADFLELPSSYGTFGDRAVLSTFGDLWITDGTATGTYPLASPSCAFCGRPSFLESSRSRIYWLSGAPTRGSWLWSSDGSRRGAAPVDTSLIFETGTRRESFLFSGETLYFTAFREPSHGIFRYRPGDGAPVQLLTSLGSSRFAALAEFAELGGRVFFLAYDGEGNPGFWVTDGTAAGARRLFDFGQASQRDPSGLVRIGDRLYFFADEGDGIDLWASDGSDAAPRRLTSFRDFSSLSFEPRIRPWSGGAFFLVTPFGGPFDLWTTDGTVAGTRPLTSFDSGGGVREAFGADPVAVLEGSLLFYAQAGSGSPTTLWAVDGGGSGPRRVVPADRAPMISTGESGFLVAAGRAFFPADDPRVQRKLWTSDGTDTGTQPIEAVCGAACGGIVEAMAELGGTFLFLRGDGPGTVVNLWRSDGTPQGSRLLLSEDAVFASPSQLFSSWIGRAADGYLYPAILPDQGLVLAKIQDDGAASTVWPLSRQAEGSFPRELLPFGDDLAFIALVPDSTSLERGLFGISPDTLAVRDLLAGSSWDRFNSPEGLAASGDRLYFNSGRSQDLWVTNGTPAGTAELWQVESFEERLQFYVPFEEGLVFGVEEEPGGGCKIWQSDGTAAGTEVLTELEPPFCGLGFPVVFGDSVYLTALSFDPQQEYQIVRYSPATGAVSALTPRREPPISSGSLAPKFAQLGGDVYFLFDEGLWRASPSAANAVRLADLGPSDYTSPLVALNGRLFFLAQELRRLALWRTDGTAAGTVQVRAWPLPDRVFESDFDLSAAAGRLWFPAFEDATGVELWTSDGTAAGTAPSAEIRPGPESSMPSHFRVTGEGELVFTAQDRFHGRELWSVEAGDSDPRLIQDLNPGPSDALREELRVFEGDLWFEGNDGLTGFELFRANLSDGAEECRPTATRLCLQDSRFAVEARWRDFADRFGSGQAVQLTRDTGYFWFFDEENVEAILKVLDGRSNNDHFWSFYGALSNVEYFLTVRDTETGAARRYFNPLRNFASVGDTLSFGPRGAGSIASFAEALEAAPAAEPVVVESFDASAVAEGCASSSTRLCLQEGRFAVEARWTNFRGESGAGQAVPLTGDTGYFWFFRDTNVETVLKVLDGRPNNGNFWVFYGALSNVDYDLVVTDCETGEVKTYLNRNRTFASVGDTVAFPGS